MHEYVCVCVCFQSLLLMYDMNVGLIFVYLHYLSHPGKQAASRNLESHHLYRKDKIDHAKRENWIIISTKTPFIPNDLGSLLEPFQAYLTN